MLQSNLNGESLLKVTTRVEMGQVTSGSYFAEVPTANTTQKSLSVCEKTDDDRIMRMLPHRTLRHHWFCSQIHSLVGYRVSFTISSFSLKRRRIPCSEGGEYIRTWPIASIRPSFFLFTYYFRFCEVNNVFFRCSVDTFKLSKPLSANLSRNCLIGGTIH
uniref:Bestrophin homolog n=1 Tax=Parascaris univalens TaxID=6257 RepID=A0A915A3I0_PARUN